VAAVGLVEASCKQDLHTVSFNPSLLLRGLELFRSERVTVSQKPRWDRYWWLAKTIMSFV
jgi:hypothetical protein